MKKPKTLDEAFALALELIATAPTKKDAAKVEVIANDLIEAMTQERIQKAIEEINKKINQEYQTLQNHN
tara:strand:+ start:129 stop:335 length:207 start_codon:yes stop_codon:yes gene_type:complete